MYNNILMRYPCYFDKFKCTASQCSDNCCRGWKVYLDKNTFEKYENINDNVKKTYIHNNIKKNDSDNSDAEYGEIIFKEEKFCPFLTKENLCGIEREFGENYLSCVCRIYPRIINKIGQNYEISLDVSCIEAAKIILLNKSKIKYKTDYIALGNFFPIREVNLDGTEGKLSNYFYLKDIRNKSIEIIQNEKYTLMDNLLSAGIFISDLQKELCYNHENVKAFIKDYNISKYKFHDDFYNYLMKISFFKLLLEKAAASHKIKGKLDDYITKVSKVFNFNNVSIFENEKNYMNIYNKAHKKIINNYEYILSNYIVNYMFSQLYPFDNNDIIFDGYIMMLFRISFIIFICTGVCIDNGSISEKDIVKIIQSFTKEFEHREDYIKEVIFYIKKNELDNMDFAKILIT